MLTEEDFKKCSKMFDEYVKEYNFEDDMINRKYHHSYKVASLMEDLAKRLNLTEEETVLAKIIGLLHDIGRFEQVKKYHSFSDKNVDHADESCHYLFCEGHIKDFVDSREYDEIIEHAIKYHNKIKLPEEDKDKLFSKMIRDMDKVDIYKQMVKAYGYSFGYEEVSDKVLEDFKAGKGIKKADVKSKSDRVLLILAFIFDINFKESLEILKETGNLNKFIEVIDVKEDKKELFEEVKRIVLSKLEEK